MFRNHRIFIIAVLSITMLLVFSGCASQIPKPRNDQDTLLLVPMRVENTSGYDVEYHYFYRFLIKKGNFERWIDATPDREFVVVSGLEPGEYHIVKLWIVNSTDQQNCSLPIHLKPGKVSLFPYELLVQFYRNKEDMKYYQKVNFIEIDMKRKQEFVQILKKYKNFEFWEFDYSSGTVQNNE